MRTPRSRSRWPAILVVTIGLSLMGGFGLRAWRQWQFAQRIERGEIQVETLRGWMTLPYIARVYRVPQAELRAAIGAPAQGHDERSLREWFDALGTDPAAGRRAIEQVLLAHGAQVPAPAVVRP